MTELFCNIMQSLKHDLQGLKYLFNHCSSSPISVPNLMSGHSYPEFMAS